MKKPKIIRCPYCGGTAILRDASFVYGTHSHGGQVYVCSHGRVTGDGPKDLLIAPLWASRKREVLNLLHHRLKERQSFQGKALERV